MNVVKYTVVVLSGGKSSRMGEEKGLVSFWGKPMIQSVLETVQKLNLPILIVANNNAYQQFKHTVTEDIIKNIGPIGGIFTALHFITTPYALVVPCDTPLITEEILRYLLKQHTTQDVLIASQGKQKHALIGIYSKNLKEKIRCQIRQKQYKMLDLIESCAGKTVDFLTTNITVQHAFDNMNTKEELLKTNKYEL